MRRGMVRRERQHLCQSRFGRREARGAVVGQEVGTTLRIDRRHSDESFDIAGIERQGTFKAAARLS